MTEENKNKSVYFDAFLLIVAFVVTVAAAFSTYWIYAEDDIEIGSVSTKKYVASVTTENTRETEKLKKAAMDAVGPVYVTDNDVMPKVMDEISSYLEDIESLRRQYAAGEDVTELSLYNEVMENGSVKLTQAELNTLLELSEGELSSFSSVITGLVSRILSDGVSNVDEALLNIKDDMYLSSIDNSLVGAGYDIISGVMECNMFVDEEATEEARQKAASEVQPVLIQKNQKIVGENEIITEEAYYALEACGFIRPEDYTMNFITFGGKVVLISIIFLGILLYFLNFNRRRILNRNEGLLLFTLYILLILSVFAVSQLNYIFIPLLGILVVITLLLSTGIAMIFTQVAAALIAIISGGGADSFLFFIAAGNLMVLMTCVTKERGKALFNGFIVSILSGFIAAGISAVNNKPVDFSMFTEGLMTVGITFVYVIIAVGSLSLWESVFGIVSDLRLSELVNPNKELIKRLMLEAPGTYHHSLIVANLAETAAYDIGANPTLARVGAYFHDIGKLQNPQYFTENISGRSPHDFVDPFTSARIIKQHVLDGVEIGKEYKLPSVILDIIYEHHGTGIIKYFYYKAKTHKKGNEEIKAEDFRYPCRPPGSKEAAIIMIADTTEAAVKSLYSNNNVEKLKNLDGFVSSIIEDKLSDGQLLDSGLTIKDLDTIKKSMLGILKGMYHTRIAYPEDEKKEEDKLEETKAPSQGQKADKNKAVEKTPRKEEK